MGSIIISGLCGTIYICDWDNVIIVNKFAYTILETAGVLSGSGPATNNKIDTINRIAPVVPPGLVATPWQVYFVAENSIMCSGSLRSASSGAIYRVDN
jgi:hypothetical protein